MQRQQEVVHAAEKLFNGTKDWVVFFREILGLHGLVRRTFTNKEELAAFERSPGYREILQMLTTLRKNKPVAGQPREEERVITVRLPKSMHDLLKREANELSTTVNKLSISKLLQTIDQELIPVELPKEKEEEAQKEAQEANV